MLREFPRNCESAMLGEGSVAFVTGAGSGIGRAAVLAFAKAGAMVCASDVNVKAAQETVRQASSFQEAYAVGLDVTCEAEVTATVDGIIDRWGRLDYAFNNAGIRGSVEGAHELSEVEFRRVIDINVVGAFLCQREELRVMYTAGRGSIVNMASSSGFVTTDKSVQYTSSKHAIIGMTKSAALEAAPRGVRVNAVAPGTIETPLNVALAGTEETMRQKYTPAYPIGRLGRAEEVAETVVFLCEDRASFIVGHALVIDGGMLLR